MLKRLTRIGKLRSNIDKELSMSNPSIDKIIEYVEVYEEDNLNTIKVLKKDKIYDTKRINGALRQTINVHGPITKVLIGSCTKRIYGALLDNSNKVPKISTLKISKIILQLLGIAYIIYTIIN